MTLDAERLLRAKGDVVDVVRAIESKNATNVSREAHRLFDELVSLDDAAWDSLLASLDDVELREQLGSIRRSLGDLKNKLPMDPLSQIRTVGHMTSFDFSRRSLAIHLSFKAGDKSLASNQDLEDTLWIGAAVVEVVSEAMLAMEGTLRLDAQRSCIGAAFEKNLKKAEDAVREARRIYTAISDADSPEFERNTTG